MQDADDVLELGGPLGAVVVPGEMLGLLEDGDVAFGRRDERDDVDARLLEDAAEKRLPLRRKPADGQPVQRVEGGAVLQPPARVLLLLLRALERESGRKELRLLVNILFVSSQV